MLTKELSTLPSVQRSFIEPIQESAVGQAAGRWHLDLRDEAGRLTLPSRPAQ